MKYKHCKGNHQDDGKVVFLFSQGQACFCEHNQVLVSILLSVLRNSLAHSICLTTNFDNRVFVKKGGG